MGPHVYEAAADAVSLSHCHKSSGYWIVYDYREFYWYELLLPSCVVLSALLYCCRYDIV